MKKIIILGLIAALLIPGCGQTDSDKIVMTVSEYEALKAQAEKASESEESAPETAEKSKAEEVPTETPKPSETANKEPADFIGEWTGVYHAKSYTDDGETIIESEDESIAYLAINEDGTWSTLIEGSTIEGSWEKMTDSVLRLKLPDFDNVYFTFSCLNGKYMYSVNHWHHYDIEMTKQ